jgi:hypothetical protein
MCLLTYLLTPWSRVLLEKLTGFAANQEIPRILWNPKVHYVHLIQSYNINAQHLLWHVRTEKHAGYLQSYFP